MPKKETTEETSEQQPTAQPPASPPPARSSSIPVLLSSLALLLAVFALAATLISSNMGTRQPLDDIKGQLSAMESRVNHMEALMATDKHGLVQAELKKMLLNLHELSRLSDDATRSEISKVETILLRLSTPTTSVKARVDLKSTAPSDEPETSTMAPSVPESAKISVPHNSQITSTPEQAPTEPKSEATSAKPVEKTLDETVNTLPTDTGTNVTPVSPSPMEK